MAFNVNVDLFNFFNHSFQNPVFDGVMPIITHFGGFSFLCLIFIVIILYAHISKRNTLKKVAIITFVAILFSGAIAYVLKHLVHEQRPFMLLDNVRLLIVEDDLNSFPSGHTTCTVAAVTTLILNMKELSQKYYKIIDVVLVVFAVIIGFSRMYIGVHYPGDILAGIIVGLIGAFIVNQFKDKVPIF